MKYLNKKKSKLGLRVTRFKLHAQSGQTLMETVAAIFILTMAITAGLALAIYAFSTSNRVQNETIAINLAREGAEVVRMMRDSNWLASDAKNATPWDLAPCSDIGDRLCYSGAYQKVPSFNDYDLNSGNQRLIFNPTAYTWTLDSNGPMNFDLYLQSDGSYTPTNSGNSVFARMINITFNSSPPYTNQNSNQELIVKSVVVWRGKNCASFNGTQDLLALSTTCRTVVEEHLTNWKDYE